LGCDAVQLMRHGAKV